MGCLGVTQTHFAVEFSFVNTDFISVRKCLLYKCKEVFTKEVVAFKCKEV